MGKINEISSFAEKKLINLEIIRLRELSLSQKEKHCMFSSHVAPRLCLSHVNHVRTYDLKAEVNPSRGAREEMEGNDKNGKGRKYVQQYCLYENVLI